jgi:hypothetical protein
LSRWAWKIMRPFLPGKAPRASSAQAPNKSAAHAKSTAATIIVVTNILRTVMRLPFLSRGKIGSRSRLSHASRDRRTIDPAKGERIGRVAQLVRGSHPNF